MYGIRICPDNNVHTLPSFRPPPAPGEEVEEKECSATSKGGWDDLTEALPLCEATVLEGLSARLVDGKPYTRAGIAL